MIDKIIMIKKGVEKTRNIIGANKSCSPFSFVNLITLKMPKIPTEKIPPKKMIKNNNVAITFAVTNLFLLGLKYSLISSSLVRILFYFF